MARHLPVVGGPPKSSLRADGSREPVHPADVRGRFATARKLVFVALIWIWALLPWVKIGGNPAVFLDIERRRFFLFGATFNAQDLWLLFFLLTGIGFVLVYVTSVAGRVWCGWGCPQTVFLEGVFRPIERMIEGPRDARMRRDAGPWTRDKLLRKTVKHALFVVAALFVAHVFLAYFVSLPGLFRMVRGRPSEHLEAFLWMVATAGLLYFDFAFFREQMCIGVCPYGRLQSVLVDQDSLVVGYDEKRGEPRGKATDATAGDCVDCNRCVVVCPTGIDIRNGLQLDCIACTACIDACDDIMDKLDRPRGLIRYDSLRGLAGEPRRILRPRVWLYGGLLAVGAVVALFAMRKRSGFEANVLRLAGPPYVVENGTVRNAFELHLVNKRDAVATFAIEPEADAAASFVVPLRRIELGPMQAAEAPLFVTLPETDFRRDFPVRVRVTRGDGAEARTYTTTFLGPSR